LFRSFDAQAAEKDGLELILLFSSAADAVLR
jgi:hypothetical protein